jgi:hypothetical protein
LWCPLDLRQARSPVRVRLPAIQCEALATISNPTLLRLLRSRSRPRGARTLLQDLREPGPAAALLLQNRRCFRPHSAR